MPNDDGNVPIKIGGTNLAHDTILDLSGVDKNYGNTKNFSFTAPSDSNWNFVKIPLDVTFKKGDIFTISFDSTLTGSQVKDGWLKTTIFNNDLSCCYDDNQDTVYIKSGNPGSKTIVVNADSDPSNPPFALVYAGVAGSTGGNTLTVENFKIERGNIPTDYSLPLGEISTEADITNLQNVVNGKANSTDVTNLQSMITGLSTKVDSLQQNSLKIVPITQADYDNLSTKDPNTIYAIGG